MKNHRVLACAGAILLLAGAAAAEQAKPAPAPAAPAAPAKLVPPLRGTAEIGFLKPTTKRTGNEIITMIKAKNLSTKNSIVGFRVDEFWYDKGGQPVTGSTFRYRKPLMPGEVIDVELRTPVNPRMDRNQYKFEHTNGTVKTTLMPKF